MRLKFGLAVAIAAFASSSVLAVDIPASSSVGAPPATAGDGLAGRYWQLGPKEIITDSNPMKTQAFDIMAASPPTATFTATEFNYQGGNDLTPIGDWLQGDAASLVGGDPAVNNMDDGFMNFTGYLAVDAPGTMDFWIGSDDGSVLWIGGEIVVDNDGGHGAPGPAPAGSATFAAAGLYPVELNYFNGDWTNDAGDHGGANMAWRVGGENGDIIASSSLHTVPEPTSIAVIITGLGLGFLGLRRRS